MVPQGLVVLFPFVLGGDFRSPLLVDFLVCFRDLALWGFGGGCMCEPFMVVFPLIPLPNP
jgi:hypothetical protein